jgi:chaperone modulatory protein CbpM
MDEKTIISGVLMDENTTLSFVDICHQHHVPEELLRDLLEHGLFEVEGISNNLEFDMQMLQRIQSARRLQHDLGINLPGVVLVLELLDEMEQLRNELSILKHHVQDF